MSFYYMDPNTGSIEGKATNQISEGGNFIARKGDVEGFSKTLSGKATDGSAIELVQKGSPEKSYVKYLVQPINGNSRCEHAMRVPGGGFNFGQRVKINKEFKIKADRLDQLTGYVLQFWQPIISPIAGIRVSGGRVAAVTRTLSTVASAPLTEDWFKLEMIFTAGRNGVFFLTGDLEGSISGNIDGGSQASQAEEDYFRPKFGWYGGTDQKLEVRYRSFRLETL